MPASVVRKWKRKSFVDAGELVFIIHETQQEVLDLLLQFLLFIHSFILMVLK